MWFSATHFGTVWVIAALVIPQSVETASAWGCTHRRGDFEFTSTVSIRCDPGLIIQIRRVLTWRANQDIHCLNLTYGSPYTCEMMANDVVQDCNEENECTYHLTYPEESDCPRETYNSRPVIMRIIFQCVSDITAMSDSADDEIDNSALTMMPTATHTDCDKTGAVIGAVIGGLLFGILATVIVVLAFVFVTRKRSLAESTSQGEPVTMEKDIGPVKTQHNVYDYSGGFDASADKGDTNADDNVRGKDNHTYDNCDLKDAQNVTSSDENARKPISILKTADETVIMDNAMYEGGDVMVGMANAARKEN